MSFRHSRAGGPGLSGYNVGDLLTLACAVAFALHIVVAEVAAPRSDPVALAFWQIVVTAVASGGVMLGAETPRFGLTPWTIVALAFTGVLATALAFAVQMWAQRETSGTHVAVIFAAEPVFATIFARIIQDERLGAHGLIGGVLIMLGILLSQVGARERQRPRGRRR